VGSTPYRIIQVNTPAKRAAREYFHVIDITVENVIPIGFPAYHKPGPINIKKDKV